MKKAIKISFFVLLVFCSCLFTSIYIMGDDIAENYKINRGEELKLDTFMPVTASYNGTRVSQGSFARHVGENFEVDLKLFGVIPITKTNVQIVDDMYVEVLGVPFGMKIYTDGVLVIDSTDIVTKNGKKNPATQAGIKIGDYIKTVNGQAVSTNEDVLNLVTESGGEPMKFEIVRGEKTFTCKVTPALDKDSGLYRIGIWVRDSSAGVGTLTFYSPSNDVVCGLGHGICDSDTDVLLDIDKGELVKAEIVGVEKGKSGAPGALKGKLSYDNFADVSLNCEQGVYGIMKKSTSTTDLTEIAMKQEVKNGAAQILCTVNGDTPKLYDCEIKRTASKNSKTQNLIVTVTDSSTAANAASTATTASTVIGTTAKAVAGKAIQHLGLKIAAGVVAAALTTTAVIGGTGLFSSESETPLNSQGDTIDENVYFDDIVNITDPDELLKDSELFSGDVVIDGKKIHFPCKLSELKECLTLKEGQDFSEYGYQSMKFIDTQGFEYNVSGYNDEKSRDEIYCYSIRAKSNNTNIIFPKGLKMGISRSEVEEIFKDYVDPRPTYSTTRSSSYSDLLLSKDLLENFTRDYAIGNEFNISYSDSLVDGISYSAKFKIEDDLYFNLEIETTEGTVWIPVPLAFEEGAVTVGNCFAVYNYQGKKYIIECYRYTAVTDRWNDTSEQGIIKEINRTKNLYYDGDWYSDTIPTLQYSDELVKCATAFYDSKVTFEKSKISIGESKTVEYPMRGATLVCGFGNTFIRHEYKIFAADFSEIPQAVIEKFESIVNNAAKNIKY